MTKIAKLHHGKDHRSPLQTGINHYCVKKTMWAETKVEASRVS